MTHSRLNLLNEPGKLLIDGQWVPAASGEVFDVYDPGKGTVLGQAALGAPEDVDAAVQAARRAFDERRWYGLANTTRRDVLWRVGTLIEENLDELAELESLNQGGPVPEIRAFVGQVAAQFKYIAGIADKIHGRTIDIGPDAGRLAAYTVKEPVGAVGLIVPWNAPLLAAAQKVAPALAAGCTLVLKPSEETPLTTLLLGEILQEAGVPDGVVNIVTGYGVPVGSSISSHPDLDMVGFTGSSEVGRLLVEASAKSNLKKLQLELGGKSPQVVLDSANLDEAIPALAKAGFRNAGQICSAGTRLFVQRSVYDRVVSGIADIANGIHVGYRTDPVAEIGPLISQKQLTRVTGYVESGIRSGGEIVAGGQRLGDEGYFFAPTVITGIKNSDPMMQEEIFGPVLGIVPFDDVEEGIALANDTEYGLAATVWTRDIGLGSRVARRLRAGSVGINVHRGGGVMVPSGGYKLSGWGRENGVEAVEDYLETKAIVTMLDR
ncbi:aldehyde dehydrogenase family protein [Microbacterium sp. No. 7]|uniref:aldehyde dehydrogenase family protein n=1 Tax=Microbacterium sp. No. 7 TaxID=1714373 RepID=UPI0006D12A5A|nr:aldehyde dehydrogenase family protein [Microbacterium sp. No. 7]ALJ19279.1 betaine-aldehyde dehydrogenase [Microbacterium sp. No. 7]